MYRVIPCCAEEKQKLLADANNRGYTPFAEETLDPDNQSRGDTKEGFYFGRFAAQQQQAHTCSRGYWRQTWMLWQRAAVPPDPLLLTLGCMSCSSSSGSSTSRRVKGCVVCGLFAHHQPPLLALVLHVRTACMSCLPVLPGMYQRTTRKLPCPCMAPTSGPGRTYCQGLGQQSQPTLKH